ncbi:MAG: cobalamin-binding protein [Planctomycetota bacterium]|nr:MAG: cobalamin-binding protein [Planctomycetota bacterium]
MRIVSLLPSATEIACALGLEQALIGRSHECDHPPAVRALPAVVRPLLELAGEDPLEIDREVSRGLGAQGTLYAVDAEQLRALAPDLVITQDLCSVCAPAGEELQALVRTLPTPPRVLRLDPRTLEEVLATVFQLGEAAGVPERAQALVASLRARIQAVRQRVAGAPRPGVVLLEWLDPIFDAGHWCPEMVACAGGRELLGTAGAPSRRRSWDEVRAAAPEVLCLVPCGYHLEPVLAQAPRLCERPGYRDLPAVRAGRVYACDADSYFARPGPRLVDGIELLAHLLHPERCPWHGPADAFAPVPLATG